MKVFITSTKTYQGIAAQNHAAAKKLTERTQWKSIACGNVSECFRCVFFATTADAKHAISAKSQQDETGRTREPSKFTRVRIASNQVDNV